MKPIHPVLGALCTLLVATACTSTPPDTTLDTSTTPTTTSPAVPDVTDQIAHLTHRWYAPDGIDLDTPEIQVARAYEESENYYFVTGSVDSVYPGFQSVYPYTLPGEEMSFPEVGTIHLHIRDVFTVTDSMGPATHVLYCRDRSRTAVPDGSLWRPSVFSFAFDLIIRRTGKPRPPATDPTTRTATPNWNVFDGWDVEQRIIPSDLDSRCYDGSLSAFPPGEHQRMLDGPPPVEPFTPGWPTTGWPTTVDGSTR